MGVGLLLIGALGVLGWMALQVGALASLGERVEVEVRFADAAGLQPGAQVAIAGVPVGTVAALRIDHDEAVVGLALDPSAGVRVDAVAQVRSRSVLGEKYVEILPRSRDARPAADGDTLNPGAAQTEIDEMVSAMGPLVAAVDPDTLSRAIASVAGALDEDPQRVSRMLANADTLLANGAAASAELPALVSEGRTTLARLRGTLSTVDNRADELEGLIRKADAALVDVGGATERLPALLDEVDGAVGDARGLIGTLSESTDEVEAILANLGEIDKWELRRLLREEGVLIRLRPGQVVEAQDDEWSRRGSVE